MKTIFILCVFTLVLLQAQDVQPTPNSKYVRCMGRFKGMLEADLVPAKHEPSKSHKDAIFNLRMAKPGKKAKEYLLVETWPDQRNQQELNVIFNVLLQLKKQIYLEDDNVMDIIFTLLTNFEIFIVTFRYSFLFIW